MNQFIDDEVIDAYLKGQLSPSENASIQRQINADPAIKKRVKLHQLLNAGLQNRINKDYGVSSEKKARKSSLRIAWKNPRLKQNLAIAATIISLVLVGSHFYPSTNSVDKIEEDLQAPPEVNLIIAGRNNDSLINGQIAFNEKNWQKAITAFDNFLAKSETNFDTIIFFLY